MNEEDILLIEKYRKLDYSQKDDINCLVNRMAERNRKKTEWKEKEILRLFRGDRDAKQ